MKSKSPSPQKQGNFLYQDLLEQLNPKDTLLLLAKQIPWDKLEREFAPLYAENGRPAKPVRLMVGLLLLKQLENLSDERVVEAWMRNPYFQAFCGMVHFQWNAPCAASDLVHFRHRIGEAGVEKIFQTTVALHGKRALEREVVIDTTVQEKNITYPTDTKLRVKAMGRCWKLAAAEGICLRRSYRRELKQVMRVIRFSKKSEVKEKAAAIRRIKTMANALLRDVKRKLPKSVLAAHKEELERYHRVINQERNDKNKIYSLHEPEVSCINKGKEHKKYEFGAKAAVAMTKTHCIIVGAKNFSHNEYDGDTLKEVLSQVADIRGRAPKKAFCDRGFRGRKRVGDTVIELPEAGTSKAMTEYAKRTARKNFGRRSAIEPIIGHLKREFHLARNYLKGVVGDSINLLLSAAAFNCRKWMNDVAKGLVLVLFALFALCSAIRRKDALHFAKN